MATSWSSKIGINIETYLKAPPPLRPCITKVNNLKEGFKVTTLWRLPLDLSNTNKFFFLINALKIQSFIWKWFQGMPNQKHSSWCIFVDG